jgi:DNA transformation protein
MRGFRSEGSPTVEAATAARKGGGMLFGMRTDEGMLAWLSELLEPQGRVSVRRMFGGHGLYLDGVFIAIVDEGRPYFKADELNAADFREAGGKPFVFESRGKRIETSYWSVPESAFDSAEDMRPWAQRALAAARRKPATKPRRSRKSASRSS